MHVHNIQAGYVSVTQTRIVFVSLWAWVLSDTALFDHVQDVLRLDIY